MKLLSLFSGIGGIDLAARWAGIETVAFCEQNKFCQKVLAKHWPDVPCYNDITTLKGENILEKHGRIDIVAGGFPCQPFSQAGFRRGKEDDRYLWPEMLRIIKTLAPPWFLGENVINFGNMGFDDAFDDLAALGYSTWAFDLPAMAFDIQSVERHLWFVSTLNGERLQRNVEEKISRLGFRAWESPRSNTGERSGRNLVESRILRTRKGFPNWMDRVKAIGNAVVPHQAYPIFKAIMEIEKGCEH